VAETFDTGGRERSDLGIDTGGFRAQQRFTDPAGTGGSQEAPAEWTAATPPTGFPQPLGHMYVPPGPPMPMGPPMPGPMPPGPLMPPPMPPPTSRELSTASLLRYARPAPSAGWRKWLYLASGKLINVGESPKVIQRNSLLAQVNQPLAGCYRIALLSLKGGVGKTTITATLGATFASIRGDRVVAVDANPDRGTLSQKVQLETPATVRHLLRDAEGIQRYSDVRSYTSQAPSRPEVLASETDPAV
jgi:hypothetical protein